MTFVLIEPDLGRISGGLRFNAELAAAAAGRLERRAAPGAWPDPVEAEVRMLHVLIAQALGPPQRPILLDGLIAAGLPAPPEATTVVLQHSFADSPAAQRREAACLRAAAGVITPSAHAAAEVARRYGVRAEVARPGIRRPALTPAQPDRGSCGPAARAHLICLGAVEDNKNQLFLAHVLRELRRRGIANWDCTLAGPITDPDYGETVSRVLDDMAPVHIIGELDEYGVDSLYRQADLLVLPSKTETYGMVVREAAAVGVPAFVAAGTGAEEALVVGRALDLDVGAWADALELWLGDEADRTALSAAAREKRHSAAHEWTATADAVLAVMERVS